MSDRFNLRTGRVCPRCGLKLRAKDSYAQPGTGHELYHFACWYSAKPDPKKKDGGNAA